MAGKNTSANGLHESRKGGIVAPFKLSGHDERQLSTAINRKLNAHDIDAVESALSTFRNLRDLHFVGIAKRQDIKRTLAHISKCQPDESLIALSNCDEFTRAEVERSLWVDMQERRGITAEMIPPAARIALERLNNSKPIGGAPNKGYQIMFAECCINLWRHCGGTNMDNFTDRTGLLSPMLEWSVNLFSILECGTFDASKTQRLIKEATQGKVSTV
jgi:hypothetical protein